jgi:flagellar hook assembly protein FlgD
MEEFRIRIFTIAGRLIREIDIDPLSLQPGFNKIHWDGRDQDGDELANGIYLYKIITKNDGITKTTIQKLAKIK